MEVINSSTGEIVDISNTHDLDKIGMQELTPYSFNPFLIPREIKLRRRVKRVATIRADEVSLVRLQIDKGVLIINQIIEQDEEQFVKMFSSGFSEAFDLTPTGRKVLQLVLKATQDGAVGQDIIYFNFIKPAKGEGQPKGISRQTWLRGTKELYFKGFIAPVLNKPNLYFINPHMFFKGDRVKLVTEFVKKHHELNVIVQEDSTLKLSNF